MLHLSVMWAGGKRVDHPERLWNDARAKRPALVIGAGAFGPVAPERGPILP